MTKHMKRAKTTFTTNPQGKRLAHIALSGSSEKAILYAQDLEQLLSAGWSRYWAHASTGGRHQYVLVSARNPKGKQRSLTVARLIAQAQEGQRVSYADGDRCNLRRENLIVNKGPAWASTDALRPRKEQEADHAF